MSSVCGCFGRPHTGPKAPVREFEGPVKSLIPAPVQKDLIVHPDQGVIAATLEPQLLKLEPLNNASVPTITATGDGTKQDEQAGATLRSLLSSCDYLGTPQGSVALGSTRPETEDNCGLASDSVRPFNWADVGELTYLGQGATGVVYRAESAAGSQVAVKFMICNTPQQLWQRAKEALLSKLVTHPNLVRTLAMDVTLVTPNTYREWGVSQQRSAAPLAAQQGSGEAGPDTNTSRSSGGVPTSSELPQTVNVQLEGHEWASASGRLGGPAPVAEPPAGQEAWLTQQGRGPVNGLVAPCDQGSDVGRGDTNRGESPGNAHSHLSSKQHSKEHLTTGSSRSAAGAGAGLAERSNLTAAGSRGHGHQSATTPGAPTSCALASVVGAEHSGPGGQAVGAGEKRIHCSVTTELHPRAAVLQQQLQQQHLQHLHHHHEQQAAAASHTCLPHHDPRQEHLLPDTAHGGGMQVAAELPGASVEAHTVLCTWASSASPHGTHSSGVSASSVSANAKAGAALQQPARPEGALQPQLQVGEQEQQLQQQGVACVGCSSTPVRTVAAAVAAVAAAAESTYGMTGEQTSASYPTAPSYPYSSPAASSVGPNTSLSYSQPAANGMYGTGTGDAGHALGGRLLDAQVTPAPEICSPKGRVADSQGGVGPEAGAQGPGDSSTDAGELTLAGSAATGGSGSCVGNGEVVPIQDILYHLDALPGRFLAKVIMEYCDGGTLLQRINAGEFLASPERGVHGVLGAMQALLLCLQEVAAGMAHLHNLNIIHGDLKPGNVLLASAPGSLLGYECKVSDFGLATALESTEQTITHENWGTVVYMAPESCAGRCRKASDVYSFGVLLWQMCTGQRPYAGLQAGQVLLGVKTGTLRLQWPSWINKSLVKVGQACMRFEPKERPGFKGIRSALAKISARLDQKLAALEAAVSSGTMALVPPLSGGPLGQLEEDGEGEAGAEDGEAGSWRKGGEEGGDVGGSGVEQVGYGGVVQ